MTSQMPICAFVANTVARQTENPKVRLPIFGSSRPLCVTCARFLRASFSALGANIETLARIVPHERMAYSAFCMPHGSTPDVVEELAVSLEIDLGMALEKPVRDSFHALAKIVGGHLLPSPSPVPSRQPSPLSVSGLSSDPSGPDTASEASAGISGCCQMS